MTRFLVTIQIMFYLVAAAMTCSWASRAMTAYLVVQGRTHLQQEMETIPCWVELVAISWWVVQEVTR